MIDVSLVFGFHRRKPKFHALSESV